MFYENLAWFTVLWVSVLVARRPRFRLVTQTQNPASPQAAHAARLPSVRAAPSHAAVGQPALGRRACGVPWSERTSPRGRPKTICTAGYACPNPTAFS